MAKARIRVSQEWQRHFAAPAALLRLAPLADDVLAVDEDAGLYLLNSSGTVLLSKQLPWMPVAIAMDHYANKLAAISPAGALLLMDRNGRIVEEVRTVVRPTSLDVSPMGEGVALADGAGRIGILDLGTRRLQLLDTSVPYYYVRFTAMGADLLAVGQYGQVMYHSAGDEASWQKDFRCHTRLPVVADGAKSILIPSPYYGIISLQSDAAQNGLFEVPDGPKSVAVTADGSRIFVINEKNDLLIFETSGRILFRRALGAGVLSFECDGAGTSLVAVMTNGAVEKFAVGQARAKETDYLEFSAGHVDAPAEGPQVVWHEKVFSALGGTRGGQLAVTPAARFVALLDIEGHLRIFDRSGKETSEAERILGRQPVLKAARSTDLLVAASSDTLLALDLRSYRQRRLALKNEWATHFDVSPNGIFFAVADFFRGVSLFDEKLDRAEYLETDSDVLDIAVDGNHRTLASLAGGHLEFFAPNGGLIRRVEYGASGTRHFASLAQGFVASGEGTVEAFDSEGNSAWAIEIPGEVSAVQPTRAGLAISTVEGDTFITNAHGTVVNKMLKRSAARYFSASPSSKEIISVEYRGRLLTARSSDSGVLWRREMDDDVLALEVSPDGAFVAVIAGIYLYVLTTAAGEKPPAQRLFLEI